MFNLQETLFVPGIIVCHLVGTSIPETESVYEFRIEYFLTAPRWAPIFEDTSAVYTESMYTSGSESDSDFRIRFAQFRLAIYEF